MKGLIVAIQFLTRLPAPRITVTNDEFARSIRWFPAAGLIVGLFVAGAAWLGALIDGWAAAWLALLAWVTVTGALHLDGLGDIADAAGGGHKTADNSKEHLLAILADPHVGSFGVVAIAVQLIGKLVLLHALINDGDYVALLLIPLAARIGPLLWTRLLPPLHEGLGARFHGAVRPVDLVCWAGIWLISSWFAPGLLAAPVLMLCWAWWLRRTIGGLSGDGHGAGIELSETGLLLAALLVGRAMA